MTEATFTPAPPQSKLYSCDRCGAVVAGMAGMEQHCAWHSVVGE